MMHEFKPTIVWFQAITCNGNTHSLLSSNSNRFELFLNSFNLIYHPSLTINNSLEYILENQKEIDFLLVEGSISSNEFIFSISNDSSKNLLEKLALRSKYIIAVGSCASFGGIHAKFTQNDDICGIKEALENNNLQTLIHPIINLSGCPVHPEWIFQTLFSLKTFGKIDLDEVGRPKELYSTLAHHGCTRNEYFEWKVEGNFGQKEGCLFYNQGCRGPMTHSSCNKILWNEISSKTRVGMPCIGCTETDFPRNNMLETKKNMGIPQEVPLGISKRAYLSISGVAKTFKIDRLHKKLME
ncbi:MAG: Ni/Fe hydrogenase [Arcobacter sp.]|jgi:hydrogenase small subunit|uniref:[Ni-Fe] hydrogenase, small subunit n=1 Tax=Arcobacter defluvii TaxID=873191 RepID=A0AAE7BHB2_9BACT|nr:MULTISPECIES: Ni/Fe hydrogenase [Arcobacter]MDY3201256.1 Ni/Fe hydrogenase [Arcobacter sp.]QKF77967.1 [Ni-Fe] hydrogenase, small subunit [Arcobacter defluvii]